MRPKDTVLVSFLLLWTKYSKPSTDKEQRFISAYSSRGVSPWLVSSFALETMVRQNIRTEAWGENSVTSWPPACKEEGELEVTVSPFKSMLEYPDFLILGPTSWRSHQYHHKLWTMPLRHDSGGCSKSNYSSCIIPTFLKELISNICYDSERTSWLHNSII